METYQKFIFKDIKTNKLIEHTCNPEKLCSEYELNSLPFYFNPVFFNKEVFSKYKMDREKYEVNSDYIINKEWMLRYYTTDDEEQIMVLLRDLSFLPFQEQIYWKSFNEDPSSKLSEKTFNNYVLGKWVEIDDLNQLKINLKNFPRCNIGCEELTIWSEPSIKNQHNLDNLDYIRVDSKSEWEDEVQTLHLNIVDGFNNKTINLIAKKMNCYNKKHQSLKQLENCLNSLKEIPSDEVEQIMSPLFELNYYRSKVISHNTGEKYPDDCQNNFKNLMSNLNISISFLSKIIQKGFFNFEDD